MLTTLAISYSIISPLVLGFATIGFACIYIATRYNALYVLTNNVDTKGAAYGRALQQLMTGVYISEICLIGLFAINTSPGPLVLMIVFLILTALYHALMRHALRPLTLYLPSSTAPDAQLAMFSHADIHDYSSTTSNVPPTDTPAPSPSAFSTRKTAFFTALFDPRRFASHASVHGLIPHYSIPQYVDAEEDHAYYNPAIVGPAPKLWIVRDEMGVSAQEVRDSRSAVPGLEVSDEFARFDDKGKITWDEERLESVPVWEKRIDY